MFALAGHTDTKAGVSSVEEWVEESSTWKAANNLAENRTFFSAVVVPRELICNPLEDNLLFITGGSPHILSSTEVYPSKDGCSPPSLPLKRNTHTMFVTSEPNAVVAICGGYIHPPAYTASCLVLDPINQRWNESRMGSLTTELVCP